MRQGKVFIFSAPSGSGKTTIVKHLLKKIPSLGFSISATTRLPRGGEKNGTDYYFLSQQEFEEHIRNKDLVEWQEVYPGKYYGTLVSEVERIWNEGRHVVFDVDVVGGLNLKNYFKDKALAVFIRVGSLDDLRERLMKRNSDSPQSIEERLNKAADELQYAKSFDMELVNDNLDLAFKQAEAAVNDFIGKPIAKPA